MSEIFPERPFPERPGGGTAVLGMELSAALPPGVIPVSAVLVVRCLTADGAPGQDMLWWSATAGLPSWEISGMCGFVQHGIRADWTGSMFGPGEEEGGGA